MFEVCLSILVFLCLLSLTVSVGGSIVKKIANTVKDVSGKKN